MGSGYDAIVLAGGTGRRLDGVDKADLDMAGATLLERAVESVASADRVVGVADPRPLPRRVVWTREKPPGTGPVATIAAGLAKVRLSRCRSRLRRADAEPRKRSSGCGPRWAPPKPRTPPCWLTTMGVGSCSPGRTVATPSPLRCMSWAIHRTGACGPWSRPCGSSMSPPWAQRRGPRDRTNGRSGDRVPGRLRSSDPRWPSRRRRQLHRGRHSADQAAGIGRH
jgi:MobA-like NTP transferase domain